MSVLEPFREMLASSVREVWDTALAPGEALEGRASCGALSYAASIDIAGAWNGTLRVECAEAVALRAAVALFERAPEDLTPDDLLEAVSEFANLVGGNLKAALASGGRLGLPRAFVLAESAAWPASAAPSLETCLSWNGGGLRVSLLSEG